MELRFLRNQGQLLINLRIRLSVVRLGLMCLFLCLYLCFRLLEVRDRSMEI